MLSRKDIVKELGKNILIVPFNENNLKENSYNLTLSKYAWANKKMVSDEKGIITLPAHSTTIVLSREVIHVGNNIGGAIHSRVGTAAKGIGHLGTMLGPNYSGCFAVPLHNITDKPIILKEGEAFMSITFDYLKSKGDGTNATTPGHIDKFSEWGCDFSNSEDATNFVNC